MVEPRAAKSTLNVHTESRMATKIQKWGNSLGVRIPKALAEQLGLTAGTRVEVSMR